VNRRATKFIDVILSHEGGYQSNPSDPGNYYEGELVGTKYGIAAPTLAAFRGTDISMSDMKNLSKGEAKQIYESRYYNVGGYDHYKNESIALLVFDAHVNQGRGATIQILNRAYQKLMQDTFPESAMSKEGIAKLNSIPEKKFFESVYQQRKARYDTGNPAFREGWNKRLSTFTFTPSSDTSNLISTVEDIILPEKKDPASFFPLIGLSLIVIGALTLYIKKMK